MGEKKPYCNLSLSSRWRYRLGSGGSRWCGSSVLPVLVGVAKASLENGTSMDTSLYPRNLLGGRLCSHFDDVIVKAKKVLPLSSSFGRRRSLICSPENDINLLLLLSQTFFVDVRTRKEMMAHHCQFIVRFLDALIFFFIKKHKLCFT